MKKLLFLSGEDLMDVDLPIIRELNATRQDMFDITWVVVLRDYGWFTPEYVEDFCRENGIKYVLLRQPGKLKHPRNIIFHWKLLRMLKEISPDIIYDSYWGMPFMHMLRWLFLDKRRFVIAVHDVVQHYKMKDAFVRSFYTNYIIHVYKYFHAFSEEQIALLKARYPDKITFYSPLYLKDFGGSPLENRKKSREITYFLFFGIIRPNKGLDLVIEAANSLGERYDNFRVIVAGKCDDWESYAATIRRPELFVLNIDNIKNEEVSSMFERSHFALLPYRDVTQSGVLLTAYNYAVPAIASRHPWFEEYTPDGTGLLFQSENVDDLLQKMELAINLNDERYQDMVRKLQRFIKTEISVSAIASRYAVFLNSLKN